MRRGPGPLVRSAALVALVALAACTGDDAATVPPVSVATSTAASSDVPTVDTPDEQPELVVGSLLPTTGPGAEIGTSMRDGMRLAVDEINAAGGVRGLPVAAVEADEGADATTAAGAVEELIARGVDVVVGPASSLTAASVLPVLTRAGVLTCSPSASAMSLDGYPDGDLFVRTIPSDSLQATAIAEYVISTGQPTAAVMYLDDAYGRPFGERVAAEMEARSAKVTAIVPFDPADDDYSGEVRVAVADAPDVVVVVGDSSAGPRMVSTLFDLVSEATTVVINDAMRIPAAASAYQRLSEGELARLSGVSPQSTIVDGELAAEFGLRFPDSRGLFAGNAYDCVAAIALAANASPALAIDDLGPELVDVTHLGGPCRSYTDCAEGLAAGRNIDYDGPSGALYLGSDGDPVRGTFTAFGFDASGTDVDDPNGSIVVGG